jgi:hypothetical protein
LDLPNFYKVSKRILFMRFDKKGRSRGYSQLSSINKDKRAVSAVVGYVLLISITLSLAVMVYGWLKFYVEGSVDSVEECDDNVQIVVGDYTCYTTRGSLASGEITREGNLTITVKNKGLWSVDGYTMRYHTDLNSEFGIYNLTEEGEPLPPGETQTHIFNFTEIVGWDDKLSEEPFVERMTLIDIQPFRNNEDGNIGCQSYVVQKIECR